MSERNGAEMPIWTLCDDKLPPRENDYFVVIDLGAYCTYGVDSWHEGAWWKYDDKVKAWMPITEFPRRIHEKM